VLSNHDFGRLASRFGERNAPAAAVLLLTLPGIAFLYQGDEIGMREGPGAEAPLDRAGRDRYRHPMQWERSPRGGFTTGEPWLPSVDPLDRNVADQLSDPGSLLSLIRRLIALRRALRGGLHRLEAGDGVLVYGRGECVVAVNTTDRAVAVGAPGELVLETEVGALHDGRLRPHAAAITRD
jgi:glycosidase